MTEKYQETVKKFHDADGRGLFSEVDKPVRSRLRALEHLAGRSGGKTKHDTEAEYIELAEGLLKEIERREIEEKEKRKERRAESTDGDGQSAEGQEDDVDKDGAEEEQDSMTDFSEAYTSNPSNQSAADFPAQDYARRLNALIGAGLIVVAPAQLSDLNNYYQQAKIDYAKGLKQNEAADKYCGMAKELLEKYEKEQANTKSATNGKSASSQDESANDERSRKSRKKKK